MTMSSVDVENVEKLVAELSLDDLGQVFLVAGIAANRTSTYQDQVREAALKVAQAAKKLVDEPLAINLAVFKEAMREFELARKH
jgi:hypothetical protein